MNRVYSSLALAIAIGLAWGTWMGVMSRSCTHWTNGSPALAALGGFFFTLLVGGLAAVVVIVAIGLVNRSDGRPWRSVGASIFVLAVAWLLGVALISQLVPCPGSYRRGPPGSAGSIEIGAAGIRFDAPSLVHFGHPLAAPSSTPWPVEEDDACMAAWWSDGPAIAPTGTWGPWLEDPPGLVVDSEVPAAWADLDGFASFLRTASGHAGWMVIDSELSSGTAIRLDTEAQPARTIWLASDGVTYVAYVCFSDSPPDDRWRAFAESITFLPRDAAAPAARRSPLTPAGQEGGLLGVS